VPAERKKRGAGFASYSGKYKSIFIGENMKTVFKLGILAIALTALDASSQEITYPQEGLGAVQTAMTNTFYYYKGVGPFSLSAAEISELPKILVGPNISIYGTQDCMKFYVFTLTHNYQQHLQKYVIKDAAPSDKQALDSSSVIYVDKDKVKALQAKGFSRQEAEAQSLSRAYVDNSKACVSARRNALSN